MNERQIEELNSKIDDLLALRDTLTCREIDAGACGGSLDYKKKHEAEERFYDAKDALWTKLDALKS